MERDAHEPLVRKDGNHVRPADVPEHALVTVSHDVASVALHKSTIRRGVRYAGSECNGVKTSTVMLSSGVKVLEYAYTPRAERLCMRIVAGLNSVVAEQTMSADVSVAWSVNEPEFVCCDFAVRV